LEPAREDYIKVGQNRLTVLLFRHKIPAVAAVAACVVPAGANAQNGSSFLDAASFECAEPE
jgi:hypothetical protein